ncbi:cysteine hydrolase [Microbulbifer sp. TYP-18]|uniref:cysteine hydrolase n=1 Tax=Microbulbifer sp. TYP-18 TaxID=3230024 RepID=UPI0034C5D4C3
MKPALLCIDLQTLLATRGQGIFADGGKPHWSQEEQDEFFARLETLVLPNVRRLQAVFRDKGLEVLHIRTRAKTSDGRDRTFWHKRAGLLATPGSPEAEFLASVVPLGDELVINKTGIGPFGNSNLPELLIQLNLSQLYCCGVHTDGSIESTIRAGADFGYCPILVEDACAAAGEMRHSLCVGRLQNLSGEMTTTDKLVEDLQQHLRSVS